MKYTPNDLISHYIYLIHLELNILNNSLLKDCEITSSQFRVLSCLWVKDGLTQSEIHEYLGIKPSSISGLIDCLEKKGFLKRVVDKEDARINRIYLTEKSAEFKECCWEKAIGLNNDILEGFSEQEKEEVKKILVKLYDNVHNRLLNHNK
ncbi:DNA-binding MarR family transcriptional regulator [Methanococcus voltae]|uniref:MarR family winged helix-turn-helix transcriptional regulator n=1 Tax=Methanococcus voltae TaxID=2188 RepID=UPI001AE4AD63|nr:MarR family winged helix-turn-helix transcriptional regulator [Methanococcus voltae]MBP2143545.1 DNA-binding MarR family transcriptional regulator [Methanococcus voltae]